MKISPVKESLLFMVLAWARFHVCLCNQIRKKKYLPHKSNKQTNKNAVVTLKDWESFCAWLKTKISHRPKQHGIVPVADKLLPGSSQSCFCSTSNCYLIYIFSYEAWFKTSQVMTFGTAGSQLFRVRRWEQRGGVVVIEFLRWVSC